MAQEPTEKDLLVEFEVVPLGIVGFWVLLAIAAAWSVIAAFKLIRRTS